MINNKIFVSEKNKLKDKRILEVKNLSVFFKNKQGLVHAVRGINFSVNEGQIVGLVGESGSGKSVTLKSLIGFNDNNITDAKRMQFKNINLKKVNKSQWKNIRGTQIGYIPQDPLMSLNPLKEIRYQLFEAYYVAKKNQKKWDLYDNNKIIKKSKNDFHNNKISVDEFNKIKDECFINKSKIFSKYRIDISKKVMKSKVLEVLNFIGIPSIQHNWKLYPHEFSGGMRQRIVIAMVIIGQPKLIIADEPTTALDVTVQAKVVDLIKILAKKYMIAVIFISHNIGLVANLCEFIYVMYAGKIVEQGKTWELFTNPRHPYTWALISSIPDSENNEELISIPGSPPNMVMPPKGDAFAPRNKYALDIDFISHPPMFKITDSHKAATWLLHEDAPDILIPETVLKKLEFAAKSIAIKKGQIDGK
ncbi:MAG: ABC transporter ATP-binding protein [Mycoplasmoidaceae bacterium]